MNNEELLQFIVCPVCKGKLVTVGNGTKEGFFCVQCQVVYPIEDEIPILLPESGVPEATWKERG